MPPGHAARWVRLSSLPPLGQATGTGRACGPEAGGAGGALLTSGLRPTAAAQTGSLFSGTVYNAGPERDSICRAWGQHHVETFDGLYYYHSGKGSYTLVGRHEPEGQTFSIQVRLSLPCQSRKVPEPMEVVLARALLVRCGAGAPQFSLTHSLLVAPGQSFV